MRIFVIVLLSLLAWSEAKAAPDPYAWCAEYGGGSRGGGTNCGFVTYEQCMWAISGNGGFCRRNLFYTGPIDQASRRTKTSKKRSRQ
jgi:hypothetical protein